MINSITKQTVKYYKNIFEILPQTYKYIEELKLIMSTDLKKENELKNYKQEFRKKVTEMFETTPYVLRTEIQDEFFTQDGIKFLIRLFKEDIFAGKEYSIDQKHTQNLTKQEKTKDDDSMKNKDVNTSNKIKSNFDPFAPPFKENFVVDENFNNLNTHRIFFSKYPVMNEHLLIVTRDFSSQYKHLTYDDIKNAVSLMYVMDGVLFFNAGKKAGASQIRKHMQCIPLDKLYKKNFGLFLLVSDEKNLTLLDNNFSNSYSESYNKDEVESIFKRYSINQFRDYNINHVFIKFSSQFTRNFRENLSNRNLDFYCRIFHQLYNICLVDRSLINQDDEESVTKDYSFLFTDEWMLVVPRKTHEVFFNHGKLNINSIGYLLMFMCNNKELVEEIKDVKIMKEVFAELTDDFNI